MSERDAIVTDEDREAAANAVMAYRDRKNGDWQARIRRGECDDGEMVQAFARHRIALSPVDEVARLREATELLQRAQAETFGGLVGGGDGGTYVVNTLSGKTLNDIRAFLARKALDTRP